jgi:hypothetical protein
VKREVVTAKWSAEPNQNHVVSHSGVYGHQH